MVEPRKLMRVIIARTVTIGALGLALTLGGISHTAEAGRVCDGLGLNSPCVRSGDLKARISLSEDDQDGRLRVRTRTGITMVELEGRDANVTNRFFNEPGLGNGLVKAWARIDHKGNVIACWRCNLDDAETQQLSDGRYEVDFTPLGPDIGERPRSAIVNGHKPPFGAAAPGDAPPGAVAMIGLRQGDVSSVEVITRRLDNGDRISWPFTVLIY